MRGPWHRTRFPLTPLGRVAEIQLGKMLQPQPASDDDERVPYLRAGSLTALDGTVDLPQMYASHADVRRYGVSPGDLVVAEGGDCGQTAFVPTLPAQPIIQNSLHRVRPKRVDIRFVRYALSAVHATDWLDVYCSKSTFGHLTREKLAALPIPRPSLSQQSAIADYLDCATSRIDRLSAARRRMTELLQERRTELFEQALSDRGFSFPNSLNPDWARAAIPRGWRLIRLSQVLLRLTNGYVGPTRDILRDEGVRYVQSLHIKEGEIQFHRRAFYVDEDWHRERPRIHLRPNDVLIVQTGDIGQVAVVPEGFGAASCHALQIARVNPTIVSGQYLGAYLQSPFGYHSLLSRATGALHPHLEGGIRDIPIVVPPRHVQEQILQEVDRLKAPLTALMGAISAQSDLLKERRRALVADAVVGELDIPAAA